MIGIQISELQSPPDPAKFEPIRNAPYYRGHVIEEFANAYRGNKPFGGLWTSTYTPDDAPYLSDWHYGLCHNELVRNQWPVDPSNCRPYLFHPERDVRVHHIRTLADAQDFTQQYHLGRLPYAVTMPRRRPIERLISPLITDWEAAFRLFDAVSVSTDAMDEIMHAAMEHDIVTAFHTWNTESTLWGRWAFERVEAIERR